MTNKLTVGTVQELVDLFKQHSGRSFRLLMTEEGFQDLFSSVDEAWKITKTNKLFLNFYEEEDGNLYYCFSTANYAWFVSFGNKDSIKFSSNKARSAFLDSCSKDQELCHYTTIVFNDFDKKGASLDFISNKKFFQLFADKLYDFNKKVLNFCVFS